MKFSQQTSSMPPINHFLSFSEVVATTKPLVKPSVIIPMRNSINIYRSKNLVNMKLHMQEIVIGPLTQTSFITPTRNPIKIYRSKSFIEVVT
jgi:hypothetical protein